MLNQISYTSGSKGVLEPFLAKYPSRHLIMTMDAADQTRCTLFDLSGEKPIFSNPISFTTLQQNGLLTNFGPFIHLESYHLDADPEKVLLKHARQLLVDLTDQPGFNGGMLLRNQDRTGAIVMLTTWDNAGALSNWTESVPARVLKEFQAPGPQNTFYHQDYFVF
ncbi:antibiotic biosynthesis monooxygenase [Limosilactobacillus fermentum]|uniref:antibiotic biosynthesis monooxygenase family protein n=1 Tax=Limosilactobacillus fermentum TaxID=1613 RepID=UPI0002E46CB6|nr:antibiotic biosynthesis monooxygenase [Limosilactobacillus fermentum]MBC9021569.1 antibiotic biosynthesis monooxygenase [Limosilactobacillus fermentum CECT 5716]MCB4714895.1 hypothetical protein [Limosilactobacillus fermentum]MCH5397881.1 antibiotic biosynthesis monooxygenase [Limosilactobacillus fermentum]MDQ7202186.1 antibiotic biosynthesis monooxygenase [Limosilactobacillus fermentum]WCL66737.1 antibiotic biosynthesis monooxygenase [Limosilactobacillus fermentum]